MSSQKSVAVVTATTGRASLQQTVDSVAAQTYPCTHYVVIDGPQSIDWEMPDGEYEAIWLPKPTGRNGIMNGAICAAAAFLTTEDLICFVDDDNWIEADHVRSLVEAIGDDKAYAYCLRKLVEQDGTFFAFDDGESLGHHGDMVDVNCYMLRRDVCAGIAPLWYRTTGSLMVGDRFVWNALLQHNSPYGTTGKYTVNYRMGAHQANRGFFFLKNIIKRSQYPDGFPWRAA